MCFFLLALDFKAVNRLNFSIIWKAIVHNATVETRPIRNIECHITCWMG